MKKKKANKGHLANSWETIPFGKPKLITSGKQELLMGIQLHLLTTSSGVVKKKSVCNYH